MSRLIQPALDEEQLRQDIASADPQDGVCLWWLGQSGFLVKAKAGTILFDPYLSDSLTRKYAATDKPHVRMTELAIRPAKLQNIDIVTSSHNHTDHLDAETLQPLIAANPDLKLVIPEANRPFVADRLGCELTWPIGINAGESTRVGNIQLRAVPAAHDEIDRDENGRCLYLGYIATLGETTIYHSGDTLRYEGMAELIRPYNVDIAILPINGRKPERRVSGNLFGDEAAQLAKDIGARVVIPCHFDMFQFNTESPELFETTCRAISQAYRVLRCGERYPYSA